MAENDLNQVLDACAALGTPSDFRMPSGYDGLGLCIIDSIWSMGVRYEGVENVVERYRDARRNQGQNPDKDTPGDLADFIDQLGGAIEFAAAMKNRQLTAPRGGMLKAEAVRGASF